MDSTTKNKFFLLHNKFIKIVLSLVFICAIWEISARIVNNSFFLPNIYETFIALCKIVTKKTFFTSLFTSVFRVVSGLLLGTVFGISTATLCYYFKICDTLLSPIISIMKATPVACIIVLLWISMNYTSLTIFVVLLMVMPIIWQNVLNGYRSVDIQLSEVAEAFEFSALKKFRLLTLPSVIEFLIPALITSIGMAWKAEIAAEIMTGSNIGKLIYDYKNISYDTASIFAFTVIIVVFSITLEASTKYIIKRIKDRAFN